MITDPPFTAYILENLLFLFVTSVPVFGESCLHLSLGHRTQVPLRISMLHIPSPVLTGDGVRMRCAYELGQETLYAVKWYRNMGEFFRYVPASHPPFKTFEQTGIDVDMRHSGDDTVFLRNLSLDSSGNFTCQVSTDKPFFRCVQTTRQLEVVVPPSDGPVLMEAKSDYEMGENVSILCNSGKSKPAPDLKWYINDQLAQSELADQERVVYPDRLESSSLALRFRLKPDQVHNGKVVLKCVSSINHIRAVTIKEIRTSGALQLKFQQALLYVTPSSLFLVQCVHLRNRL